MTRKQFDEWVERMLRGYEKDRCSNNCDTRRVKNVIICVDCNNNVGIAKCHPSDEFNALIGTAIAYARMRGFEVPKVTICKKLSEMKNGEMFKSLYGNTYRYIGKNIDAYVSYRLEDKKYCTMPHDLGYEMVD
jgi:hypothetical protein